MLRTLHQNLRHQQNAAHQAFASLASACSALEASLKASPAHDVCGGAASKRVSSEAIPSPSLPPPTVREFTQLLRRVEVLHHFLFRNVYMHHRESVLSFMAGVERSVFGDAPATFSQTMSHSETSADVGGGSNRSKADTSHVDEEQRELRRQITQLRYQLARPAQAHIGRCFSTQADGPTSDVPLQTLMKTTPSSSFTSYSSPLRDGAKPDASSSGLLSWMHTTSSAPAHAEEPALQRQGIPRPNVPRIQLFALSSAFREHGIADQHGLDVVLDAVQRRLNLHAVLLHPTSTPEAEADMALRLGCLFLVVPQHHLRRILLCSGFFVISYEAILADLNRHGNETRNEGPPNGCDEGISALEELFVKLEADMPPMNAIDPVWSLPPSTPVAERGYLSSQELVVQRSALHRDGCRASQQWKRHRSGSTMNPHEHLTAAKTAEDVDVRTPAPAAHSNATADLFRLSSRVPVTGPARLQAGAPAHAVSPVEVYDGAADPDIITPSQQFEESQHVGITQHALLSRLSVTPSSSAHATPVLHPQEDTSRAGNAAAPAPVADVSVPQLVFQISNSVKYLKAQLMEAISQLGGVVDQSSGYSRACRYLVVAEGITERTEKYLGACAAATYIVPPRFVFDSQRRGYWLVSRVKEYDMNPQRGVAHRPHAIPIFSNWRVVLITSRSAAARGVLAALLAGGCTQATAFVVDLKMDAPMNADARLRVYDETCATTEGVVEGVSPSSSISAKTLQSATHILVECSSVTAYGHFQMPDWVPTCVRQPEYEARMFTLELLYFCLCAHPDRVFDADGLLSDMDALTPACRIESL
ncbi:hypothetical protein JKF63_04935 [Porcisia hertigi]|uniref:BRCT domain-containing protein n=1 Tax=Porcisia hertigi TaxID=2761500 RepID=A0A836IMZ4_9TRYP|nr:hypothetical protein JKF63_04935 [Porcisia hertigi]